MNAKQKDYLEIFKTVFDIKDAQKLEKEYKELVYEKIDRYAETVGRDFTYEEKTERYNEWHKAQAKLSANRARITKLFKKLKKYLDCEAFQYDTINFNDVSDSVKAGELCDIVMEHFNNFVERYNLR